MLAVLVNLIIPVDHWLELTLNTFDNAMGQKLVVVSQEGSSLLWLHVESSAKSVQDEF